MIKPNSLKQKVKKLMFLDQRARDDDRYLVLKIWESEGLVLSPQQRETYMSLSVPDVITRRRREWSKVYPPSAEALERRYKHYKEFTDEFSKQSFFSKILKRRGI